jgi:Protein NO VEIN, C-terminal
VKRCYESDGWSVRSVEAQKVGYDLCCDKGDEQIHLEVKGTQGDDVVSLSLLRKYAMR